MAGNAFGAAPTLPEPQPCLTALSKQRLCCKDQQLHLPKHYPSQSAGICSFASGPSALHRQKGSHKHSEKVLRFELIESRNKMGVLGYMNTLSTSPNRQSSDNRKADHGRTTGIKKSLLNHRIVGTKASSNLLQRHTSLAGRNGQFGQIQFSVSLLLCNI